MSDPSHQCPRCRGRMFLEWDLTTGVEYVCVNCSHSQPVVPFVPLPLTTNAGSRRTFMRSA